MRKIDPSRQAEKFLRRVPPKHGRQPAPKIRELATDPNPSDSKPLEGFPYCDMVVATAVAAKAGYLFAVGTLIAERPPHRSVRAGFPHTAPTLGV
jgi:hypothetical protein